MKRLAGLTLLLLTATVAQAHEPSRKAFLRAVAMAEARAAAQAETPAADRPVCQLTIRLADVWTKQSVPGLVRLTNLETNKAVRLTGEIHRAENWHALAKDATVTVPRTRLRIEALRGLSTLKAVQVVDLQEKEQHEIRLALNQFYDPRGRRQYAGNTHLHLMKLTHAEADRYLRVVPQADQLDLVFLSHLRRIPDERDYVSNQIVEDSFQGGSLKRLSQDGVRFANGQEHRHNFGRGGEGFGHVMLLDLQRLIRPVSIGPGIMREGSDGRPLRTGIKAAREDGASVIWCHNKFGFEDLPNWIDGLVHAQNIFDGGTHGTYADTFYRYLNIGMRVPFSTGTDWFIYDFSRVYVPVDGELTAAKWLNGLREGKSYITNGPFLELDTERAPIGGTLDVTGPNRITVVARGFGRVDFRGLELVHNGRVVHRVKTRPAQGFFMADMRHGLEVDGPGWFALRIPLDAGKSELGRPLFAHTSPIYIQFKRREQFDVATAKQIVREIKDSQEIIKEKGTFETAAEKEAVLGVYRQAVEKLQRRIDQR